MISPFLVIPILLVFFMILGEFSKDIEKIFFPIIVLLLTLFLAFRYGQGTDFFGYKYLFEHCNTLYDAIWNPLNMHSEIGMRLLYSLFDNNYEAFNAFIAFLSMFFLFRSLKDFQFNRFFSLVIFYPTCYLTYFYSGVRQGLALAIFLGLMLNHLVNKKYKLYCLWGGVASCFHSSALLLIILPFFVNANLCNAKKMIMISISCGFLVFALGVFNVLPAIQKWKFFVSDVSILSYVERTISLFVVYTLSKNDVKKNDMFLTTLFNVYVLGSCVYYAFWCLGSISRVHIYFKSIECILIPYCIWKAKGSQYVLCCLISMMAIVMTVKNIGSYIKQGGYYPDVSVLNYPYVSIFDYPDKIFEYRARIGHANL